jgi:hypothetical protein
VRVECELRDAHRHLGRAWIVKVAVAVENEIRSGDRVKEGVVGLVIEPLGRVHGRGRDSEWKKKRAERWEVREKE